jgi:hypothetical protein
MNKQFIKEALGLGFLLWLIGYVLGFVFFAFVPAALIGWYIMPIGLLLTFWVLLKKIDNQVLNYYLGLGLVWALVAIVFDYLFLVKLLKPVDGYYKLDVYLYYTSMLILPIVIGLWKQTKK